MFSSLISITSPVEFVFWLFYTCSLGPNIFQSFCLIWLIIYFFFFDIDRLNARDVIPSIQLYYADYAHVYNRL